jgi:hypothetical protein
MGIIKWIRQKYVSKIKWTYEKNISWMKQYTQSHKPYFNNTNNIIKFMWLYDHHHVDITHKGNLIMVMWLKHVMILIISLSKYILCLYLSFVNCGLKDETLYKYTGYNSIQFVVGRMSLLYSNLIIFLQWMIVQTVNGLLGRKFWILF